MAKIPMRIDPKGTKKREVTVVVHVDGREYTQTTQMVEEWAIPFVAHAALIQVEDPDYDAAADAQATAADREVGGSGHGY